VEPSVRPTPRDLEKDWLILDGTNLLLRGTGTEVVRAFGIMSGVKGGQFNPPTPAELSRWGRRWNGPLVLARVQCEVEKPRRASKPLAPVNNEDGFN